MTTLTPTKATRIPIATLKDHLIVLIFLGAAVAARSLATQDSQHAQESLRDNMPTQSVECDVE